MVRPLFNPSSDHFAGPVRAGLELLLYMDYQCEHCSVMQSSLHELEKTLSGDLRIVIRHFPIPQLHPFAFTAAMAAEAASVGGKFWSMHRKLLDNHAYLNDASIRRFAQEIGLAEDLFETNLANPLLMEKVTADLESGLYSEVQGTPTIFINGSRYEGFDDFSSLLSALCRSTSRLSA